MPTSEYPHVFVKSVPQSPEFKTRRRGRDNINFPERKDRRAHADFIRSTLDKIWADSRSLQEERRSASLATRAGTYIQFESAPNFDLKTRSLDMRPSGIRLLTVSTIEEPNGETVTRAVVFVPAGKEPILLNKIERFRDEESKGGRPKNEAMVSSIESLRAAVLESLWRDKPELIPKEADWCEAWLRCPGTADEAIAEFRVACQSLGIPLKDECLSFPERAVVLIKASEKQLNELLLACDVLAEFRRAKATSSFFARQDAAAQAEWANNLAERIELPEDIVASACFIDTGANNGHILLSAALVDSDCHTINADWGVNDEDGHGTLMCGVGLFGDALSQSLQSTEPVLIPFKLESVKLIPGSGNHHKKELYGLRTKQALARAEGESPESARVACLSITSEDGRDLGRPSSWSGSVDQLAFGSDDKVQRLIVVAGGNILNSNEWKNYPDSNLTLGIQDPGQSWNALTVGAYTEKDTISEADLAQSYFPIAEAGQLSPFSSTSLIWEGKWPNKPDIVFEGGNAGIGDQNFVTEIDDLSVLSTSHRPQTSQFGLINATSAASAQAARLAALLFSEYPDAWPETIRALMVHTAEWPEALRAQFYDAGRTNKRNTAQLLRICGYGCPTLSRAMSSAQNSLTLVLEQEITPFRRKENSTGFETNEMHLVELPWPKEALRALPGETDVTINVTLSYFIEPGPGEVGWRDKYRYRSHGLDFDLKGPTEDAEEFLKKLNKAAAAEDEEVQGGTSIDWVVGNNSRSRGSVHRDWWTTTAAQAAECNYVGVFPRTGWWKERNHLDRGSTRTRYSLVVTVETPSTEIDIYTPVATQVAITNQVET